MSLRAQGRYAILACMRDVIAGHAVSGLLFAWNVARRGWPVLLLVMLDVTDVYERIIRPWLPWDGAPATIGFPTPWAQIVLAVALAWGATKTYHEARTTARLRPSSLQIAKQVLLAVADHGFQVAARGDFVDQPSRRSAGECFGEACRVLEAVLSAFEANEQRRRVTELLDVMSEPGLSEYVLRSTAEHLRARATEIDESDLNPSFDSEGWVDYRADAYCSSGDTPSTSGNASR